jgi:hypothetical protein
MSKVNANTASREELVEAAGLRPDLAEAILEFRGKHGGKITDVNLLEELPGVGPATIDQLRKELDFSDKGGNGSDQSQAGERSAREAAGRATEAASSAVQGSTRAARDAAETGARVISTTAREGLQTVARVTDAVGEVEHEALSRSAELGRLWVNLLGEQTRHNLEIASALGRAVRWDEVVQVQSDFMRASFERLGELNRRYLEIVQGMMETNSTAIERAKKAG